ncbi:hypothetical protein [Lysinibacillus sp. G4S2]|uniref:hypothetical protein n=1 Tax=Lysinibacillus sp. G4S2 TaxID=3055859 RepID=UPI0025A02EBB|nr:hypothetical protein [Lysinibacillus sp. G4S2]MDM5247305.1 hypothetical protein [Lysinibacillus sp. G4S2]
MNKDLLLTLMNRVIRVDRGGPESRIGKLLAAEDDHFVLLTEKDGIVYYKTQHIKSITLNSRDGMEFNVEDPAADSYLLAPDFKTVVGSLRHHWVKVNRGGPEMLEGIMDEVSEDYITIFSKEEIIRLAMYHVRNISLGTTSEKAAEGKKDQGKNNENKNSEVNDSDESSNNKTENNNKQKNEKAVNDRGRNVRNRRR